MSSRIDGRIVARYWTLRGLVDFFIGFDMLSKFDWYSAFFWHQGLEKLCKAYLLGAKSIEYETLPKQKAREKINDLAKNRKAMGHDLTGMLDKLIKMGVLQSDIKRNIYARCKTQNRIINCLGRRFVKILEKAYIECRYPLNPKPIKRVYWASNRAVWWDPISSSELMEFAFQIGLKILDKIEQDFHVVIPRDKTIDEHLIFQRVENEDWLRFRRTFFKENI